MANNRIAWHAGLALVDDTGRTDGGGRDQVVALLSVFVRNDFTGKVSQTHVPYF